MWQQTAVYPPEILQITVSKWRAALENKSTSSISTNSTDYSSQCKGGESRNNRGDGGVDKASARLSGADLDLFELVPSLIKSHPPTVCAEEVIKQTNGYKSKRNQLVRVCT